MRVFVTGANGWIGSATVDDLLAAGHEVVGLVRSDASAERLSAKGATPLRGDLDDLESLTRGARETDATVHLANKHDWSNPAESNRAERAAVQTIGDALAGSGKPFLLAAGVAGLALGEGRAADESDVSPAVGADSPRGGSENLALEFADRGVVPVSVRFAPTVHGMRDHGFIAIVADAARRAGESDWIGDGQNAWAAVHVTDAARLVRLGVEQATAGLVLHAVAEEGVPTREIAEGLGSDLELPVGSVAPDAAMDHFGFIARFWGLDMRASSARTRELTGWTPTGPTLLQDVAAGAYR